MQFEIYTVIRFNFQSIRKELIQDLSFLIVIGNFFYHPAQELPHLKKTW